MATAVMLRCSLTIADVACVAVLQELEHAAHDGCCLVLTQPALLCLQQRAETHVHQHVGQATWLIATSALQLDLKHCGGVMHPAASSCCWCSQHPVVWLVDTAQTLRVHSHTAHKRAAASQAGQPQSRCSSHDKTYGQHLLLLDASIYQQSTQPADEVLLYALYKPTIITAGNSPGFACFLQHFTVIRSARSPPQHSSCTT
jgi:hypothetical protein